MSLDPRHRKALYWIEKISRQLPGIDFCTSDDDKELKLTSVVLGFQAAFESKRLTGERGSDWCSILHNGRVWVVGYYYGHPDPVDNGYRGMNFRLKPFESHPEGFKLYALLIKSYFDIFVGKDWEKQEIKTIDLWRQ